MTIEDPPTSTLKDPSHSISEVPPSASPSPPADFDRLAELGLDFGDNPDPEREEDAAYLDADERYEREQKKIQESRKWRCRGCKKKPSATCECRWCVHAKGPCHHCGLYYDVAFPRRGRGLGESQGFTAMSKAKNLKPRERVLTGIEDVDRMLGGGLVLGNTLMLGGERGAGKTTLLLQMAGGLARAGVRSFFASGEMTPQANLEYALRLGVADDAIGLYGDAQGVEVNDVFERVLAWKAKVLFLDSIQVAMVDDVKNADIGTPTMIDAVINMVTSFAQQKDVSVIAISHLTKSGDYAGTEKAQHLVDGLLRFERREYRDHYGNLLSGTAESDESLVREVFFDGKSRQGSSTARAVMLMTADGLHPVPPVVRIKMSQFAV